LTFKNKRGTPFALKERKARAGNEPTNNKKKSGGGRRRGGGSRSRDTGTTTTKKRGKNMDEYFGGGLSETLQNRGARPTFVLLTSIGAGVDDPR